MRLSRIVLPAVFCLLSVGAGAAGPRAADLLETSRKLAAATGLIEAPCPLVDNESLPAWFEYRRARALHVAEAAVLLPLPLGRASEKLDDVAAYPEWVLVGPAGAPNLRDLTFDPDTGAGHVRLGDSDDGVFAGRLTRARDRSGAGVRIEMSPEGMLRTAALEVAALRPSECAGATLVTLRLEWKLGWPARWLAGEGASIPALFLLAIRDDLAALALRDAEALASALDTAIVGEADTLRLAGVPAGGEGRESWPVAGEPILRVEPAGIRASPAGLPHVRRILELALAGRETPPKEIFPLFFGSLSGRHEIAAYTMLVGSAGDSTAYRIAPRAWDLGYDVDVVVGDDGGTLSLRLNFPPR